MNHVGKFGQQSFEKAKTQQTPQSRAKVLKLMYDRILLFELSLLTSTWFTFLSMVLVIAQGNKIMDIWAL